MTAQPRLSDLVRPGARVALADGAGAPVAALAELSALARERGGVRLVLGWMPGGAEGLEAGAFADVRALMGGWGLRRAIDAGDITYVPSALGTAPSLVRGPLRPDVLLAAVVPVAGGYAFGSEVAWMRAAVDAGATVAAVVNEALPHADAGPPLPPGQVVVVGRSDRPPAEIPVPRVGRAHAEIGARIARLVPEGVRLQIGPGPLGAATLAALEVPVRIDSGLLVDAVVDLDARGLLLGEPSATYLAGTARLYGWAHGRGVLHPVEVTHDAGRLAATPLIAVNTVVEIDADGQVNVEGTPASTLGGIGGHPDFAAAASRSAGLSVVAVPTTHGGASTLVERLSRPVSTLAHDVDVVVTELGSADLRGLGRGERRAALAELWGAAAAGPVDAARTEDARR